MTVCFIVASMDKRIPFLERCINHYKASKYAECDIYCYFQGSKWESVQGREVFKGAVIDPNPRGVFTPRYELMKRFAKDYDYCIIIDDDLYILPDTDYDKTIKFIRAMKNHAIVSVTNTKVNGLIEENPDINIEGGMVFPRSAILEILDYFKDKERDYTFDYFWYLCYVKGYDLYRDRRSRAQHVPCRRVDGKLTGFNESIMSKPYIPMMTEYFRSPGTWFNHRRIEPNFTRPYHLTDLGKREREANKKKLETE